MRRRVNPGAMLLRTLTIMKIPTPNQFEKGYLAFQRHEGRESMYRTATFLVEHFWRKPREWLIA